MRPVLRKIRIPDFHLIIYRSTRREKGEVKPAPRSRVTSHNIWSRSNSQISTFNKKKSLFNYTVVYSRQTLFTKCLTPILLTWTIWRAPTNASKWRMGFNSAFKGLMQQFKTGLLFGPLIPSWLPCAKRDSRCSMPRTHSGESRGTAPLFL